MLYTTKPDDFNPKFEVVSCFVEHDGEILLLHRQDHKPEPNTRGVPAGKIDLGETKEKALIREIWEETGINLEDHTHNYSQSVFVKYPDFDFIYHIFSSKLENKPQININTGEHKTHTWQKPEEALKENLIQDLDACIKIFYNL